MPSGACRIWSNLGATYAFGVTYADENRKTREITRGYSTTRTWGKHEHYMTHDRCPRYQPINRKERGVQIHTHNLQAESSPVPAQPRFEFQSFGDHEPTSFPLSSSDPGPGPVADAADPSQVQGLLRIPSFSDRWVDDKLYDMICLVPL